MDIQAIDHIEFFVEDVEKSAAYLREGFGFTLSGRGGGHPGGGESILLRQRGIAVLLTSPAGTEGRAAEYVRDHGDGVGVIGLRVPDAAAAYAEAVGRGATPLSPPETSGPPGARVVFASVSGFGDVAYRLVSREQPGGAFAAFVDESGCGRSGMGLFSAVDHFAICVPGGTMADVVDYHQRVFGLGETYAERIVVGTQAMESTVVQSASGRLTLTILEPDGNLEPGQIDAFVKAHGGAGVQHVAFLTEDIATAVRTSAERGVTFLPTPGGYYDMLPGRLGPVGTPVEVLRELNVLADRDQAGIMLQIFTQSTHPRRTLFYEVIERRGANSFGSNNIHALYDAIRRQEAD
ncbi:4-hydroxyphenylpyruvate dioxygenase [Herbidospora sp. NBRC 101105]|uniref:4-hydroxyphenylpyruvate dioxygenase n=1 Tax=Herbidospora sp. NBRC 101105 TaxID=3032195 RepID=UPI0024A419B3|nr:4-hydroxyphenylpyruvate dioxygenase [Herbidospora sp. NBRC 101105]GLX99198.1 4-hydroxyphenylpyruvate dioxygenase [Herbidospora sp. NBRC 101105]